MELKAGEFPSTKGNAAKSPPTPSVETMRDLLAGEVEGYKSLQRGDVVEGVVMEVGRDGVLVDISSKSEGIIHPQEMLSLGLDFTSQIKVGDAILAYVLQPEDEQGQITLSLDRARGEKGWRNLQQSLEAGEILEAEVVDFNRGGLVVGLEGLRGFVPASQVVSVRHESAADGQADEWMAQMVGKRLPLKVIEINRRRNRLILSERAALQEQRSRRKEQILAELRENEVRKGRVSSIREYGVFVDLGGIDGLVHLSELSWEHVEYPDQVVKVGDEVEVHILKVDRENRKVGLSLRRAKTGLWTDIMDRYQVGQCVKGKVTKLANFGAFARIDNAIEGLIHISELADRRVGHPKEVVQEGEEVMLKIVRIEPERCRLGLSLRQAQEECGAEGGERDQATTTDQAENGIEAPIAANAETTSEIVPQ